MAEILMWMWLGSIAGAILVSPRELAGNSAMSMLATLPAWVFLMVPLTMVGWIVEVVA